jgi:predicted ribosome quality control (RQC) complex YloA/Tae2 family protein
MADVALLRVGRHFRFGKNKIIVGRNEVENKFLTANKVGSDFYFEPSNVVGPITLLQGPKTKAAIETAAKLTASYSDAKSGEVTVKFGKIAHDRTITVTLPKKPDVDKLRVGNSDKIKK